jgi:hypothetical protein
VLLTLVNELIDMVVLSVVAVELKVKEVVPEVVEPELVETVSVVLVLEEIDDADEDV